MLPDKYILVARVSPAVIVGLPVVITLTAWIGEVWTAPGAIGGGLVSVALSALLSEVVRDLGKLSEDRLFEKWSGKPTAKLFRLTGAETTREKVERFRNDVQNALPEISLPTEEMEGDDAEGVDRIYDAVSEQVLELIRDDKLLVDETRNYGLRRNLYGVRWYGAGIAFIGIMAGLVLAKTSAFGVGAGVATVNLLFLLFFVFVCNSNWVRRAAVTYADRYRKAVTAFAMQKQEEISDGS